MDTSAPAAAKEKICFVAMPISDPAGYESGHFARVYEYILKPAIIACGMRPIRADEVRKTNYIVIDILHKLLDSDIILCDISGRNPNVLFELGIAQSFNKPTCLIKDQNTEQIFDIQGLRNTQYDQTLRVDTVKKAVADITQSLKETLSPTEGDVNSLLSLLSIKPASLPATKELGADSSILLSAINNLSAKVSHLDKTSIARSFPLGGNSGEVLVRKLDGSTLRLAQGDTVWHNITNDTFVVTVISGDYILLQRQDGSIFTVYLASPDIEDYINPPF